MQKLNPENLKTKDLLYLTGDEKLEQKNYEIMLAQNIRQFSTNQNYQLTKTIFFEMDKGSEIIHNLIMSKSMHCVIEIHVNKFKWSTESFHKWQLHTKNTWHNVTSILIHEQMI